MNFWKKLLGIGIVNGECVPRAFMNSIAWAIDKKCKVYIADVKGHFQAVGENVDGELEYLEGNGWGVWIGDKEGDNPIYKMRNLRNAMEHFIKHNPWCMPTEEEQLAMDKRIRETFGTDENEVA